ncbi:MAG: tetratricopeptide repeat protein, partial [Pirellulaceae bacterium]
MANSPHQIRRDTRVFISCVSRELGTVRQLIKKGLEDNDYHAVVQESFPPDYRQLVEKLEERIRSCDAMIHIAGHCYGAEPKQRPDNQPRRSYTQLEYDIAVKLGKPVYVFVTADGFPSDQCPSEDDERRQLQAGHRQRLTSSGIDYNPTRSREELAQKIRSLQFKVESLQSELVSVDQKLTTGSRKLAYWLAGLAVLALVSLGIGWYVIRQLDTHGEKLATLPGEAASATLAHVQELFSDPDVLSGKIKSFIRQRADEELAKARDQKANWQQVDEIHKRRDQALENVEDLIANIRDGLTGDPDPIFTEAARILAEEGPAEAIEYLESKRPDTLKEVDKIIESQSQAEEKKRELLGRILMEADLHKTNLAWNKALELYKIVVDRAPKWSQALGEYGRLLRQLARYSEARPLLEAAEEFASGNAEISLAANDLGLLENDEANWDAAEPLYRRALAIDEQSYGAEHPYVAIRLNNLALLLYATNRLAEAELLLRRALAIVEQSYGAEHPNVARELNNLAGLI